MAVNQIIIPNYDETLAFLSGAVQHIESSRPPTAIDTIDDYNGPCIIFKGSPDCGTIYYEDYTVYPSGRGADDYNYEQSISFIYRTKCGDTFTCSPPEVLEKNGRTSLQTEYGDGKYCALMTMTITEVANPLNVFVDEYEYCVEMYCCQNKVETLKIELLNCMAAISCKIDEYKNIGRNFTKLTSKYLKMSNLLWVMNNNLIDCKSYNTLACLFKKI